MTIWKQTVDFKTARIRKVVDRFIDWRGAVQELECGHILKSLEKDGRKTRHCYACQETGKGGEVVALHDIRCGCYRCSEREPAP